MPSLGRIRTGNVRKKAAKADSRSRFVNCPICETSILEFRINDHIDEAHLNTEGPGAQASERPEAPGVSSKETEGGLSPIQSKDKWWTPPSTADIPVAHAKLSGSGRIRRLHPLNSAQLRNRTPCEVVPNALPKELAEGLLQDLQLLCGAWTRGTWHMFGKAHEAPRTSCYFELAESQELQAAREQGATFDISADVSTANPPERLLEATEIVNRLVTHASGRVAAELLPDDRNGWESSYALANCYRDGSEGVGPHSDRLQTLGPRAIIASLSLGAKRTFRISRADLRSADDGEASQSEAAEPLSGSKGGAGASPVARARDFDRLAAPQADRRVDSVDIPLPHNTLVIMWPPTQEEWRHAVPKCKKVESHSISGQQRFNLTFRKTKPGWVAKAPNCRCNRQSVLKAALGRGTGRQQRYYYQCDNTKNAACGFWKWMDSAEIES